LALLGGGPEEVAELSVDKRPAGEKLARLPGSAALRGTVIRRIRAGCAVPAERERTRAERGFWRHPLGGYDRPEERPVVGATEQRTDEEIRPVAGRGSWPDELLETFDRKERAGRRGVRFARPERPASAWLPKTRAEGRRRACRKCSEFAVVRHYRGCRG
jgi:hypothetical protein